MQIDLIVSRHPAAVEFIRREALGGMDAIYVTDDGGFHVTSAGEQRFVPVLSEVTADDVRGKHVAGNLPLHLAEVAEAVYAVEFAGPPPRGREYTVEEMEAAGANLRKYVVFGPPLTESRDVRGIICAST